MRRPGGLWAAIAISAALATTILGGSPALAEDYPSWSDVEAAKGDETAKQAEVDRISTLLTGLEARAAELGDAAVQKGAEYGQAQADLQRASTRADTIQQQADAADAAAETTTQQVGRLAAQIYRSGGDGLGLDALFDEDQADALLYRLGAMSKLTEQAGSMQEQAEAQKNTASLLSEQAGIERTERDRLAAEAQKRLDEARAAQEAADAEVEQQKQLSETLYAQLASLKDTTAQLEESYRQGQIAAEQYRQQQEAAARDAAAESDDDDSSGGGDGGGLVPPPPGAVIADPATAKAYAQEQLNARGWGGNEFNCLVALWNRESGWRVTARNPSSGAYGIPQSLPGSKMASAGADWQTNAATQVNWGLGYIAARYGSPCGAWAHSQNVGWY
ncbi:coiled-coil domain-containing protein [Compostimonas suwonensis]|uniref:Septal ring factor EnvC (AmiA/AmiB activator) n=1 Tax=Compostimonas suwonensis TaxID=1048394 RepID=A0A2M9BZA1_9MICO|nr:hypothetical protein [Compostimonas suwonensis]PJJ63411.1 hypothetical protein CLV54_1076 [Compostimonas suwonensis]